MLAEAEVIQAKKIHLFVKENTFLILKFHCSICYIRCLGKAWCYYGKADA